MDNDYSTIIKVEYVKKGGSVCRLSFDNAESFECSTDLVLKYGLAKGTRISANEYEKVLSSQRIIDVKQSAYSFASYKPRTEFEVRRRLKQKKYSDIEIGAAINFLYEFNLLNDKTFAEKFIDEKLRLKKYSSLKMIDELRKRGVNKAIAEEKVSARYNDELEFELAKETAEKKLRTVMNKPEEKRKQAIINFLRQKRFNWEIIKRIIDEKIADD